MRDPRPRCVLVVGDGFTQSFLQATGVAQGIRCTTEDLIPAPQHVQYLPTEGDPLSGPLWDAEKWPRLYNFWRELGEPVGRKFFEKLGRELPINQTVREGGWTFSTQSLAYQLRAYLWHFFRGIDRGIDAALSSNGHLDSRWEWTIPLVILKSEFVFDVVSFNYDVIIDNLLLPLDPILPIYNPLEDELNHYPSGTTFLSKPHGSIRHNFYASMGLNLHPNPWLQDYEMESNLIRGRLTTYGLCPKEKEVVDKGWSTFQPCPIWSLQEGKVMTFAVLRR